MNWYKKAQQDEPYDWDKNYGKRFKFVKTPEGAQVPPTRNKTISLVTPANGDAWNWEEITGDQLEHFRKNWSEIQKTIGAHKRIQIETGQNAFMEEEQSTMDKCAKGSCWKGYKRVGMKRKGKRLVPNCVPKGKG